MTEANIAAEARGATNIVVMQGALPSFRWAVKFPMPAKDRSKRWASMSTLWYARSVGDIKPR